MALDHPDFLVRRPVTRRMDRQPKAKAKKMGVDMTELEISRQPRVEDPGFRQWIGTLPCACCDALPTVAAHVRFGLAGGTGRKPDDGGRVLPLCDDGRKGCHRVQHSMPERLFWQQQGIDPLLLGTWLWEVYLSGGDRERAVHAIRQCRPAGRD